MDDDFYLGRLTRLLEENNKQQSQIITILQIIMENQLQHSKFTYHERQKLHNRLMDANLDGRFTTYLPDA